MSRTCTRAFAFFVAWALLVPLAHARDDIFDVSATNQTIENFGASDCWHAQVVGTWSNEAARNAIADLLFSRTSGIGLSCWRFNLGGGLDSTITNPLRTVETFETAQGQYDWTRQPGSRWFLQAAKTRSVPQFLAFANSPTRRMTKNGHTYCSSTVGTTNLKSGYAGQYAKYLVDILKHFRDDPTEGITFNYISPVNEPQWAWESTSQEGNRASNADIKSWVQALDAELKNQGVATQIAICESGSIPDMYSGRSFVDSFLGDASINTRLGGRISYHSYWSDDPSTQLIQNRQNLGNKMQQYPGWKVWMTEYCIMQSGRDLTMNTALLLARILHYDLSLAGASAWQWWLGMSPGDYKDGLIYVDLNQETYVAAKMLWALGNYSRFIRPGARRISFLGDNSDPSGLLASGYRDDSTGQIILVYVNMGYSAVPVNITLQGTGPYMQDYFAPYVTSDTPGDDLKAYPSVAGGQTYTVPARSVVTLVSGAYGSSPCTGVVEDFEGLTAGDLGAQNGWTTFGGVPADVQVVTTDSGTNQAARFLNDGVTSPTSARGLSRGLGCGTIGDGTVGTLYLRFRFESADLATGHFGLTGAAPAPSFDAFAVDLTCSVPATPDGTLTLCARRPAPDNDLLPLQAGLLPGAWYSLWIVADNYARSCDVYLRGPSQPGPVRIGRWLGFCGPTPGDLAGFMGLTPGSATSALLLDDLWIGSGVQLTVPGDWSNWDYDGDGDVDQEDFGHFQACLSPGPPTYVGVDPGCETADLNADGEVDGADFVLFGKCMGGPDVAIDPACRQ